jgi:predicted naringenin-chalcone synthase
MPGRVREVGLVCAARRALAPHPQPPLAGRRIEWKDSTSLLEPGQRAALMFEQRNGMLRNVLTRAVPALAADYAQRVLATVLARSGLTPGDVSTWIMHAGGRDVLQALQRRLELQPCPTRLRSAGRMPFWCCRAQAERHGAADTRTRRWHARHRCDGGNRARLC